MQGRNDRLHSNSFETFSRIEEEAYNLVKERTEEHRKHSGVPLYKTGDVVSEIMEKAESEEWSESLLKVERGALAAVLRLIAERYFRMNDDRTLEVPHLP